MAYPDIFSFSTTLFAAIDETSGLAMIDGNFPDFAASQGTYNGVGVTYGQYPLIVNADNTSVAFNGSTGYAFVPSSGSGGAYNMSTGFAFMAVIRPVNTTGQQMIFENDTYGIYLDSGVIKFRYSISSSFSSISSSITITPGKRYTIIAVHTGTQIKLYVDAVLTNTVSVGALDVPNAYVQIARRKSNDWFYNGVVGFVTIFDQVLLSADVTTITDSIRIYTNEVDEFVDFSEDDHVGLSYVSSITESDRPTWGEVLYMGAHLLEEIDEEINIDEDLGIGAPRRVSVTEIFNSFVENVHYSPYKSFLDDSINLTDSITRHGTFRMTSIDPLDLDFTETIGLHESIASYFEDESFDPFGESIRTEFVIGSITVKEALSFGERLTLDQIPNRMGLSEVLFQFAETLFLDWGLAHISIAEQLTLTETVGLRLAIWQPHLSDVITFTEQVNRIKEYGMAEGLSLIDSALRTYTTTLIETLVINETLTVQKVRAFADMITFFEDVCPKNTFNRTVTDLLAFSETIRVYSPNINSPINNPTYIGWNDITEAEYNNISQDQWNNLLETTPTDNTGFVNFPTILKIKIKESVNFIEALGCLGGRAHCDNTDPFHVLENLTFAQLATPHFAYSRTASDSLSLSQNLSYVVIHPANITAFKVVIPSNFPDGTYAELTFDTVPSNSFGASLATDFTADTSGGPEEPDGGTIGYDRNDGMGNAIFNCTTPGQVDTFTVGGSVTINSVDGFLGANINLPVTLTITS